MKAPELRVIYTVGGKETTRIEFDEVIDAEAAKLQALRKPEEEYVSAPFTAFALALGGALIGFVMGCIVAK